MIEPIHTLKSRSTADSIVEGRIKEDVVGMRKKRKQILKKSLKKVKKNNFKSY